MIISDTAVPNNYYMEKIQRSRTFRWHLPAQISILEFPNDSAASLGSYSLFGAEHLFQFHYQF